MSAGDRRDREYGKWPGISKLGDAGLSVRAAMLRRKMAKIAVDRA
jgi:hypothetical protein